MMRINQFSQFSSNSVRAASSQQNSRTSQNGQVNGNNSGMPDFSSAMQRQDSSNNTMPQMPGAANNLQPVMPGNVPSMPPSGMPENMPEMPAMPDGEMPLMPDRATPPELPEGTEPPAMPDGNSNMPPMMPGEPQGMQRPGAMSGNFSGMSGMSRFNAMSFMMNR